MSGRCSLGIRREAISRGPTGQSESGSRESSGAQARRLAVRDSPRMRQSTLTRRKGGGAPIVAKSLRSNAESCEIGASLRGRELGNRGTSTFGRRCQAAQ
jgi:hypothetical protein